MVRQGRLLHAAPWDFDLAFDFACMPRYFTNVFTGNVSLGVPLRSKGVFLGLRAQGSNMSQAEHRACIFGGEGGASQ